MEAGENLMRMGRYDEGIRELRIAEKAAPEFKAQIDITLSGYGIK